MVDLRKGDAMGRLGGEEFGILLQNTDLTRALKTAERLRKRVEAASVEHTPVLKVTTSIGIALLDDRVETTGQWLAAADQALYRAKSDGRNRCCLAESLEAKVS